MGNSLTGDGPYGSYALIYKLLGLAPSGGGPDEVLGKGPRPLPNYYGPIGTETTHGAQSAEGRPFAGDMSDAEALAYTQTPEARNALMAAAGPALNMAPGTLAGANAIGANLGGLRVAQTMAQRAAQDAKLPPTANFMELPRPAQDYIHSQTGWFQLPDGGWRFEIPDNTARLKLSGFSKAGEPGTSWQDIGESDKVIPRQGTLSAKYDPDTKQTYTQSIPSPKAKDVLAHPDLFRAYPDLAKTEVQPTYMPGARGGYSGPSNTMFLGPQTANDALYTTMHELAGHGVQGQEGFVGGTNPGAFLTNRDNVLMDDLQGRQQWLDQQLSSLTRGRVQLKNLPDAVENPDSPTYNMLQRYNLLDPAKQFVNLYNQVQERQQNAFANYMQNHGEIEARVVADRSRMSPEQLAAKPPYVHFQEEAAENGGVVNMMNQAGGGGNGLTQMSTEKPPVGPSGGYSLPTTEAVARYNSGKALAEGQPRVGPSGPTESGDYSLPQTVAYHGSPHDFDQFDISKIGTGEGAQAYGHGLYFAEREGIAKSYRDALQKSNPPQVLLNGHDINFAMPPGEEPVPHTVLAAYRNAINMGHVNPIASMKDYLSERVQHFTERSTQNPSLTYLKDELGKNQEALDWLDRHGNQLQEIPAGASGKLYQAKILAHPDSMLDWDKKLSEMPLGVQEKLKNLGFSQEPLKGDWKNDHWNPDEASKWISMIYAHPTSGRALARIAEQPGGKLIVENAANPAEWKRVESLDEAKALGQQWAEPWLKNTGTEKSGEDVIHQLQKQYGKTGAAEKLYQAGIPGIKYLDASSRNAARPSVDLLYNNQPFHKVSDIPPEAKQTIIETMDAVSPQDVKQGNWLDILRQKTQENIDYYKSLAAKDPGWQQHADGLQTGLDWLVKNKDKLQPKVTQPMSNYVVFHHDLIKIAKKYGIGGLGLGLGAAATQGGSADAQTRP